MTVPSQVTAQGRPAPRWALLLFAGLCAWLQAWTPAAFTPRLLTPLATDHYHEYADALLHGQLHLARAPEAALLALPDPYDPVANAPYRVNDLSYHAGRYYLYHSIVPAAIVFAPVRVLTGQHLSVTWACWLMCVIGTCAALWTAWDYHRRCAANASRWLLLGGGLAVAFCQGSHVALRQGTTNLVPIASAYAFAMLTVTALWQAHGAAGARRLHLLAWGSVAGGLAVACRPNYAFGIAGCLILATLPLVRATPSRTQRLSLLAVAGLPAAACVATLLLLNVVRFGHPLEFGMRTMLGGWDQRQLPSLSWTNAGANLYHYLLAPGIHQATFPFVTASSWTALGVLLYVPVLWLIPFALLAWRHWPGAAQRLWTPLACLGLVNFTLLVLLPSGHQASAPSSANARYLLDFLPGWVLASVLATLALGHQLAARPRGGRLLVAVAGLLTLGSLLATASLDLARYPLESIRPVARILSRPAWWWQELHGRTYGPILLELELPANRFGAYEPLVATGDGRAGELLHLFYESPGVIRLGLVDSLAVGPASGPIAVDYTRPLRFEIHLGSLYPPDGHPALAGLTEAEAAILRRRLVVRLDGRTVFEAPAYFRPNTTGRVLVGHTDFLLAYAQAAFTGRILSQSRGPLVAPTGLSGTEPVYGALRLRLQFPADRADITEPLVTTGIPQAGDVLHVTYRADGAVRFGVDHWGRPGLTTDWIERTEDPEQTLEYSTGALYPPEGHATLAALAVDERRRLKERVLLRYNGRVVLDAPLPAYEASPYDVFLGCNPIGASSSIYSFSGRIVESGRIAMPTAGH